MSRFVHLPSESTSVPREMIGGLLSTTLMAKENVPTEKPTNTLQTLRCYKVCRPSFSNLFAPEVVVVVVVVVMQVTSSSGTRSPSGAPVTSRSPGAPQRHRCRPIPNDPSFRELPCQASAKSPEPQKRHSTLLPSARQPFIPRKQSGSQ